MKYEHLQKLDHEISQKLDHNEFTDYTEMVRFLYKKILVSTLSDTDKQIIVRTIRDVAKEFSATNTTNENYYEFIIQTVHRVGNQLLSLFNENFPYTPVHFEKIALTEDNWTALQKFGINKISQEGIAYRGGKARIITKYLLKESITPADYTEDTDLFLAPSVNRLDIIESFQCDNKGVRYIPSFSSESLEKQLLGIDCSLNQTAVTKDYAIFSDICKKSLQTGIIQTVYKSRDIYGEYIYLTEAGPIYSGKMLRRLIKPLTDGRAISITLPKHQILPENSDKINFGKNILAHIRNYLKSSDQKQLQMYHRLGYILFQIGTIQKTDDVFSYLKNLINKHPDFSFASTADPIKQEANWLMKKLIHLTKDVIAKHYGIENTPLDNGYDTHENSMINIYSTNDIPDDSFSKQFQKFHTRLKTMK